MGRFFTELRRRQVFKVAAVYAVVAWLLAQALALVLETYGAPLWVQPTLIAVLLVGFPIAIVLAWAFEMTPAGVVQVTKRSGGDRAVPSASGGRLTYTLIGLLIIAVGWVIFRIEFDVTDGASLESMLVQPVPPEDGIDLSKSIAVLPLANLSPDPDNAYFAAGIHEEILTQLARNRDLTVIARTSVLRYLDTEMSIPEIAKELQVGTVMEGSVQYAGNRVHITLQLNSAATGAHIWAESYDRDLDDIFEIQSDIAARVAQALQARLNDDGAAAARNPATDNMEAYNLYLAAVGHALQGTSDLVIKIQLLERAIELDPKFAAAHGLLAIHEAVSVAFQDTGDPVVSLEKAERHAALALSIDPNSVNGHLAMAYVNGRNYNWAGALAEFEHALELSPNSPGILDPYARVLQGLGRDDEAIAIMERVAQLAPTTASRLRGLTRAYRYALRYDDALENARNLVQKFPADYRTYMDLRLILLRLDRVEEAAEASALMMELVPSDARFMALRGAGYAEAAAGNTKQAEEILAELLSEREQRWIPPFFIADVYVGLGETELSLDWYEKWVDSHDFYVIDLVNPGFDPVIDHPRYQRLLERAGLAGLVR